MSHARARRKEVDVHSPPPPLPGPISYTASPTTPAVSPRLYRGRACASNPLVGRVASLSAGPALYPCPVPEPASRSAAVLWWGAMPALRVLQARRHTKATGEHGPHLFSPLCWGQARDTRDTRDTFRRCALVKKCGSIFLHHVSQVSLVSLTR